MSFFAPVRGRPASSGVRGIVEECGEDARVGTGGKQLRQMEEITAYEA